MQHHESALLLIIVISVFVACSAFKLQSSRIRHAKVPAKVALTRLHGTGSDIVERQKKQLGDLGVSKSIVESASKDLINEFYELDMKTKGRLDKILNLYERERIDASSFHGVDGYGHGDLGREKMDLIVADLMGAEAAIVRLQLFSGTHAIASALFGMLRPGDKLLGVSGPPYDTLEEVIGLRDGTQTNSKKGSLLDWGISYEELDLIYDEGMCM